MTPWSRRFAPQPGNIYTRQFEQAAQTSGPLSGLSVAIKDLYDVQGLPRIASQLNNQALPPAEQNADAVQCLIDAGADLNGYTVSTQLAFSGIGQNPDYGVTQSLWAPDAEPRIAGGSTRGGALAVAAGFADLALGTDTGGSCRIPAACNGLYGIKFSASQVSLQGCQPLATSLDSAGLMSADSNTLRRASQAMIGGAVPPVQGPQRFVVPAFSQLGIDPTVAAMFGDFLQRLEQAGHQIIHDIQPSEIAYREALAMPPLAGIEAYRQFHGAPLQAVTDPRVAQRIQAGGEHDEMVIEQVYATRIRLRQAYARERQEHWVLMPTLQDLPPRLSQIQAPEDFVAWNARMLRNSAYINLADGCAISAPLSAQIPVSVTLAGASGQDLALWGLFDRLKPVIDAPAQ